jgi:hypothetical protein
MVYTISVRDVMFILQGFTKAVHSSSSVSHNTTSVIEVDAPLRHITEKSGVHVFATFPQHALIIIISQAVLCRSDVVPLNQVDLSHHASSHYNSTV